MPSEVATIGEPKLAARSTPLCTRKVPRIGCCRKPKPLVSARAETGIEEGRLPEKVPIASGMAGNTGRSGRSAIEKTAPSGILRVENDTCPADPLPADREK